MLKISQGAKGLTEVTGAIWAQLGVMVHQSVQEAAQVKLSCLPALFEKFSDL